MKAAANRNHKIMAGLTQKTTTNEIIKKDYIDIDKKR